MAWRLNGTYFESCSCDAVCPCTWSGLTARATSDRCRALLAYHVESGQINDVDVSGLNFALFLDTPPVMSQGDWRAGVYLDDAATDTQAEQLGTVLSGQAGGPPAMLAPLISEMLGVEKARITYSEDDRGHHVRIGDDIDVGVEDFVALEGQDPVRLTNVFHPSNTTLTVAPANAAHLQTFGIDWGREGYGSYRGRSRDLRAGAHHGAYCLGCCWGLMVILIAVGVMNIAAMIGLAAVVLIEKTWRWGTTAGRAAGVSALVLAVAVIWLPWLAPGLHAAPSMMMS